MSTIISVHRHRKLLAVCNANCYDAKTTRCKCVCQGMNHGVGFQKAKTNVLVDRAALVKSIQEGYPNNTMINIYYAERPEKADPPSTAGRIH